VDAIAALLKLLLCGFVGHRARLQRQQTRYDLQIILDPVVDFPQERFLFVQ
jgi:hypothetical protein